MREQSPGESIEPLTAEQTREPGTDHRSCLTEFRFAESRGVSAHLRLSAKELLRNESERRRTATVRH